MYDIAEQMYLIAGEVVNFHEPLVVLLHVFHRANKDRCNSDRNGDHFDSREVEDRIWRVEEQVLSAVCVHSLKYSEDIHTNNVL